MAEGATPCTLRATNRRAVAGEQPSNGTEKKQAEFGESGEYECICVR